MRPKTAEQPAENAICHAHGFEAARQLRTDSFDALYHASGEFDKMLRQFGFHIFSQKRDGRNFLRFQQDGTCHHFMKHLEKIIMS
jgi:hypothetical protein